ncbi:MAG: zinc ribbon domain-containing protein [Phycisphaera sp.]|nr:zinc ribbon domain-containing protein [Phycisphaera sp.]
MPTYDYRCDNCGHEFEQFQSITANALRKCPECGKLKLKRLIGTGGGVIFKGSGFYQTDYRSESYNKAKAADAPKSESTSSSESKSEKKAESKPDTKKPADASTSKKSDSNKKAS